MYWGVPFNSAEFVGIAALEAVSSHSPARKQGSVPGKQSETIYCAPFSMVSVGDKENKMQKGEGGCVCMDREQN